MGRLFGTDGVRGKAGEHPLDVATVRRLGAALARALRHGDQPVRFLAGRDTRESGGWIERELAFGVRISGRVADQRRHHSDARGRVSDAADGLHGRRRDFRLAQSLRGQRHQGLLGSRREVHRNARAARRGDRRRRLVDHSGRRRSRRTSSRSTTGRRTSAISSRSCLPALRRDRCAIVIDCANGATTTVAPRVFEELGLETRCIGCEPDGRNINLHCGSTAPELLAKTVVAGGYDLGIAYDGDGDRAIFVDAGGRVVDGDAVMLMCAKQMKAEGRLKGDAIVATVMSNIGLEIALREAGIGLVRCQVGDKYVMEEMLRRGFVLGGEQSGHVIFSEYLFTGDGLATSLNVLRTMAATRSVAAGSRIGPDGVPAGAA